MDERQKRREEASQRKAEARERKLEARRRRVEEKRGIVEAKRALVEAKRELARAKDEVARAKEEQEERAPAKREEIARARSEAAEVGPTVHPGALEPEPVFGGEVYVVDIGPKDAPAVVLVHGVGDNAARDWDGLIPRLVGRHRVIAFDLPGFGRSTKANVVYKPDSYIKLIEHIVTTRLEGPFSLIGHSMGGAIALGYAGANPGRVERLIVADAAGILHRHAFGEYALSLGIRGVPGWDAVAESPIGEALGGLIGGLAQTLAHKVIRPYFRVEPDPSKLFELETAREKILGGDPMKIAGLFLITHNFGPAIAAIRAAPLLVWGAKDLIAPLRTGLALRSMIPGARLEVLEECGHVPMRERRERFNELVVDHLEAPPRSVAREERSIARPNAPKKRLVGQRGGSLAGEWSHLVIEDCEGLTLAGVRAKRVSIARSSVEIEDCIIDGDEVGLEVEDSRARLTGGGVRGRVAIRVERGDLDLAGVAVEGLAAAVRGGTEAQVLFSVCPVRSPRSFGFLHGVHRVGATEDI